MRPDWDYLMKRFEGHASVLVGDVDCTADGEPLCEKHGVQGVPTIKWGDPSALEEYEAGSGGKWMAGNGWPEMLPELRKRSADMKAELKEAKMKRDELEAAGGAEEEVEELMQKAQAEVQKIRESRGQLKQLMKAVKATKGSSGSEEL